MSKKYLLCGGGLVQCQFTSHAFPNDFNVLFFFPRQTKVFPIFFLSVANIVNVSFPQSHPTLACDWSPLRPREISVSKFSF
jgi:hypothetical protein